VVFPGGAVDPGDRHPEAPDDEEAAARRAAAREAREEADVALDPSSLVLLSRWCPPVEAPKRFNTWFFVGRAPEGAITVDGSEIDSHRWMRPAQAIAERDAGRLELIPPTWITLHQLRPYADVAGALAGISASEPALWVTRLVVAASGARVTIWDPDAAFEHGDLDRPGPRNRLYLDEAAWRYETG